MTDKENIGALQQSAEDMATILLLQYPQYDLLHWSMVGIVFAAEAEKKMSKEMRKHWRQAYHNCLARRVSDITCDEK